MAKKETKNEPKEVIEAVPEEVEKLEGEELNEPVILSPEIVEEVKEEVIIHEKPKLDAWAPKTKLGKAVKSGTEKNIDKILREGKKILEPEIVDFLLNLETELLLIGQAKGKFGGGKRRAWRQTQKKTQEGNIISFSAMAVVGDKNSHVGLGYGKASETLPAREKALRNAKLNLIKIERGFESPENEKDKSNPHTVPFKIKGKCGSARIIFWPAPRGTGLVAGDECKKILRLAGIKDIYSKTKGKTKTTINIAKACINALEKTTRLEL